MKKFFIAGLVYSLCAIPAMAADLAAAPVPYIKAPPLPMIYDWSGLYLGGFASYSWSTITSTTTDTPTATAFAPVTNTASAFHGGGQVGFDYMLPYHVVLGVVGDISTGEKTSFNFTDPAGTNTVASDTFLTGSFRGKLGLAFNRLLIYGTGGWAYSDGRVSRTQVTGTVNNAAAGTVDNVDVRGSGWTAGGGMAFAFAQNWNAFAEYRYTRFNNGYTFTAAQRAVNGTVGRNLIEVGLNYKTDWGPVGCPWYQRSC